MKFRLFMALMLTGAVQAGASGRAVSDDFWDFMGEEAKTLTVASPSPESVFSSVSNVVVIDRADIVRYNYSSVSEALQSVPGLSVIRTYLMHRVPTARGALQEHYANKILVMINNVPMWHAMTGEGDLDRVGIDSVQRIEVLLGPASVLYGSNALTGAVNIVLREPRQDGEQGGVSGGLSSGHGGYSGRLEISQASGYYAWKEGETSYTVAANSRSDLQPTLVFEDESGSTLSLKEYVDNRSLSFSGRHGGAKVLLNAYRGNQNYLGNSLTRASGALENEVREGVAGHYSYTEEPAWGQVKYSGSYDWQRRNIPRDAAGDLRSDIVGSRLSGKLEALVHLPAYFTLESGAGLEYRYGQRYQNYYNSTGETESDNGLSRHKSREDSFYAQLGREEGDWKLLAGGRYTKDSNAGDNLSGRASAIYMPDDHNSIKAIFSQSFRTPTPFEQYFITSTVTVLGNPDLKPERTESWELAWLSSHEPFFLHVTGYYASYMDTIYRARGNFTRDGVAYTDKNYYYNAPGYHATGVEVRARYETRNSRAFLSFERLRGSRDDERVVPASGSLPASTSWNFKYWPRYNLSGGLAQSFGRFFAMGNFNLFGESRTLRGRLPAQFWADLSVGYRAGSYRHTLAVRDLTDRVVRIPEYVRLRSVENLPLYTGRRLEYTFDYRF